MSEIQQQPNACSETPSDDWDLEYPHAIAIPEPAALAIPAQAAPNQPSPPPPSAAMAIPKPIPMLGRAGHFPAFMSRGALFGSERPDPKLPPRPKWTAKTQGEAVVECQGTRLNMRDKEVWQIVIDLAKEAQLDMNEPLQTQLSEIARRLGANVGGGRVLRGIWATLERLAAAQVDFVLKGGHAGGGRMLLAVAKGQSGVEIRLDPNFVASALDRNLQIGVDAVRRRSLGSPLAEWLHDFFTSHETAVSLDLGYLRALCGFENEKRRFPSRLRAAMQILIDSAPAVIVGYGIEGSGKDSDLWRLVPVRGQEAVLASHPKLAPANTPPKSKKQQRRSGVRL
jgi:hypothetical protein